MEYSQYLASAESDLVAICVAVADGPLESRVPSCPDFSVGDLTLHVAAFCLRWTEVVREGRMVPFRPVELDPLGDPAERANWLAGVGQDLIELLRSTAADSVSWSWYEPDQTAGFIARRVAHELCMHRVDAQLARGDAGPIDAALAADGIEEMLFIREHHSRFDGDPVRGSGRTMHLHGTDLSADVASAEWMFTFTPDGLQVTREHGKGDLALRGAVGDLERLLYQRPTAAPVEMFGDGTVLEEFYEVFTF